MSLMTTLIKDFEQKVSKFLEANQQKNQSIATAR